MGIVNVSAQHGKAERHYNGLEAILKDLIENPRKAHIVMAVVRRAHATIDDRKGGTVTPTVNHDWVEVATGRDADTVREIMRRVYTARTGNTAPDTAFEDRPAAVGASQPGRDTQVQRRPDAPRPAAGPDAALPAPTPGPRGCPARAGERRVGWRALLAGFGVAVLIGAALGALASVVIRAVGGGC